ncbi:DUF952 domain-containing protein [Euzebya sp.]|uniref:DUF952 domain-containing protein n=1 Tax=Euzebya sp. TaxID=1971409 RepID=UPI003518AB92
MAHPPADVPGGPLDDQLGDPRVVHAIGAEEWAAAGEAVRPPSLESEGFIHLSTPSQIAWVCDQRYADRDDLVLLVVHPDDLPIDLVWEDCEEVGQDFPHLYAPLPRTAVQAVLDYRPGPDGRYPPPELPTR